MPIVKKRNEQTETRLLLESDDPVELPPAQIDEKTVLVQFDQNRPFIPELVEVLREGSVVEPVPVMMDGSTFAIHGPTRTFWIKIWHAAKSDMRIIERVQVISCLPSTRGVQVVFADSFESDDYEDEDLEAEGDHDPLDDHDPDH
jgi:hypothetical protein